MYKNENKNIFVLLYIEKKKKKKVVDFVSKACAQSVGYEK